MEEQENIFDTSDIFKSKVKNLGKKERKKVFAFMQAFQQDGFDGINNYRFEGRLVRNKKSDDIDKNDPDFIKKVKFVQQYDLWHFHAGFYHDDECDVDGYRISDYGDLTSQWVIHYQKFSVNHINAVDITPHPPFNLPPESAVKQLEEETEE